MNSKKVGKSNGLEENSSLNRILEDMGEYEERKNGKRKEIRKYRNGRRKEMNEKEMIRSFDGYRGVNERIGKKRFVNRGYWGMGDGWKGIWWLIRNEEGWIDIVLLNANFWLLT